MGMADLKMNSEIHHLKARIAELEAALHIATNDKLSLLDQLDQAQQARMAQIDYGCDLQRIIEDLCRGGPIREPKTSARHHYDMAKERLAAEALSRTGAVKVKALEWTRGWMNAEAQTEIGQYTITYRRDGSFEWGIGILKGWSSSWDEAKAAAQADYERRVISALTTQPAAPEGRQEAVAWADEDMARHWIDRYASGIDAEPQMTRILSCVTRPSEQAVTEAMVEAGLEYYAEGGCSGLADYERREVVEAIIEAALKAAMEAGRHG